MDPTKTVLITGAGGNFGRALGAVFARDGYAVAGIDNDRAALDRFTAVVKAEGRDPLPLVSNLRDWSEVEQAVEATAKHFGRIDVVINSATARTTPVSKPLEEATAEEFDLLFGVGPRAALGLMRAALPHLKKVGGSIINIGSGAGLAGRPGLGIYSSQKAALHTLTYVAAREWGPHGVRVNGILPFMMTEQLAAQMAADPELIKTVSPALGRVGDPEADICTVALFLASPAAGYITGQNISVDGGNNMR